MLAVFLSGLALLVGLLLLARWYAYADTRTLMRIGKIVLIVLGTAIVLALAVTGRLGWAIMSATALAPLVLSVIRAARQARNFARMSGMKSGRTSRVETRFLRMTLDIDSGDLDGEIVEGPFAGRWLSSLGSEELLSLLAECRAADGQSAQILEAYLDRHHPEWRRGTGAGTAGSAGEEGRQGDGAGSAGGPMSREQAYRILGLEPGADEPEIRGAYQRLIALLHPDRGGSSFLAAQVNRARDVLLKERGG